MTDIDDCVILHDDGNRRNPFYGKSITLRSIDPNDPSIVATTIINGFSANGVTFTHGENSGAVLDGFTITGCHDGIYCDGSSPTISNCIISNNANGGIYCQNGSSPFVTNCTLSHNSSYGLYCSGSSPNISNCIIASNSSYGVECASDSSPLITNCSVVDNNQRGISASSGSPEIVNCILWDNGDDLYNCSASYSCIENGDVGVGNIYYMPYFVDAEGGDYHLRSYSPCIDAGDPNSDYFNEPESGGINMGAYGNTSEAETASLDTDADGLPDTWERNWWPEDVNLSQEPEGNPDGDNFITLAEYLFGYNPTVATVAPMQIPYFNSKSVIFS